MALTNFTVTGSYAAIIADSADEGSDPDIQGISALVLFTPSVSEVVSTADGLTYRLAPIQCRLEETGELLTIQGGPVRLTANTAALGPLPSLSYRTDFSHVVYNKLKDQRIEPFRFEAPTSDVTIDLATVARIPL